MGFVELIANYDDELWASLGEVAQFRKNVAGLVLAVLEERYVHNLPKMKFYIIRPLPANVGEPASVIRKHSLDGGEDGSR